MTQMAQTLVYSRKAELYFQKFLDIFNSLLEKIYRYNRKIFSIWQKNFLDGPPDWKVHILRAQKFLSFHSFKQKIIKTIDLCVDWWFTVQIEYNIMLQYALACEVSHLL